MPLILGTLDDSDYLETGILENDFHDLEEYSILEMCKAARDGDSGKLKSLLQLFINSDITYFKDSDEVYLLHAATSNGHTECVELLLKHNNNSFPLLPLDQNGRTAIHHAARSGQAQCLKLLLAAENMKNCNDFPRQDKLGITPWHYAAAYNHSECIKVLIENTKLQPHLNNVAIEEVNTADIGGWTPLHTAIDCGNIECAQLLIAAGANIEAVAHYNNVTPLHVAVHLSCRKAACIKILAEQGANLDAVCILSATGSIINIFSPHSLFYVKNPGDGIITAIATLILSPITYTPLHLAAWFNDIDSAITLLEYGANLALENTYGKTPLDIAVTKGHTKFVQDIIDYGFMIPTSFKPSTTLLADIRQQIPRLKLHESMTGENAVTQINKENYYYLRNKSLSIAIRNSHADDIIKWLKRGATHYLDENNKAQPIIPIILKLQNEHLTKAALVYNTKHKAEGLTESEKEQLNKVKSQLIAEYTEVSNKPQLPELIQAQERGKAKICLRHGQNANVENNDRLTALHLAAKLADIGSIALLLRYGANQAIEGYHGETVTGLLQQGPLHKVILAYMYNVKQQGEEQLRDAAANGNTAKLTKLFKRYDLNLACKDSQGRNILHIALWNKQTTCAQFIVNKIKRNGTLANNIINATDNEGNTPLQIAARDKVYDFISILTDLPDLMVYYKNKAGKTALSILANQIPTPEQTDEQATNNVQTDNELNDCLIASLQLAIHPRAKFYQEDNKVKKLLIQKWQETPVIANDYTSEQLNELLLPNWVIVYYRKPSYQELDPAGHVFLETEEYRINIYEADDGGISLHEDANQDAEQGRQEPATTKMVLYGLDVNAINSRYAELKPKFDIRDIEYDIGTPDRNHPKTYSCANLTLDLLYIGGIDKLVPKETTLLRSKAIVCTEEIDALVKNAVLVERQRYGDLESLGLQTPLTVTALLNNTPRYHPGKYILMTMPAEIENNPELAQEYTLYIKANGDYIVRDAAGAIRQGSLITGEHGDPSIDLKDLSNNIKNKDFKKQVLVVTAKRSHTSPASCLNKSFKTGAKVAKRSYTFYKNHCKTTCMIS